MFDSNMLLYGSLEIAALLLIVCLFLIRHVGGLKKLVKSLEVKVISLRESLGLANDNVKKLNLQLAQLSKRGSGKSYLELVREQIENTRQRHISLNPGCDVSFDLSSDTPAERQAAALRYAFLDSEQAAIVGGKEGELDWDVLAEQLNTRVLPKPRAAEPDEEPATVAERPVSQAGDELDKLHSLVDQQKKEISDLERKLAEMDEDTPVPEVVEDLQRRLGSMKRCYQESEACTKLLETELEEAHRELEALRASSASSNGGEPPSANPQEIEQLENLVNQLTDENNRMLKTIAELEQQTSGGETEAKLRNKLEKLQQALLNLQTRYIELEERYSDK